VKEERQLIRQLPLLTFKILVEMSDNNLTTQGWIGEKPCLVTDTGASMTIARLDVAAG
jgi:hypothetical protein